MVRFFALALTVVLTTQAAPAFAQSINVHGKLNNNSFVTAVCSVGANGQITGTGLLYGQNPNGSTWKYPFVIRQGSTIPGSLVLTGNMAVSSAIPITLTAAVPNGPLTFTYTVNGSSYTLAGTGTVTVK